MATFQERLEEALQNKNISPAELSRVSGVNEGAISQYRKGKYKATQPQLEKLSKALNVSIPWLMGADVPMNSSVAASPFAVPGIMPPPHTVKKPRLGTISCGQPIDSEENFEGYDDVPDTIKCDFTLICEGDSMIGARINSGDLVYIRQQPTVESGQIAAVLVDGQEKLLKRVYIESDCVILQAENPAYKPIIFYGEDMNKISIIGRAVGFTSSLK